MLIRLLLVVVFIDIAVLFDLLVNKLIDPLTSWLVEPVTLTRPQVSKTRPKPQIPGPKPQPHVAAAALPVPHNAQQLNQHLRSSQVRVTSADPPGKMDEKLKSKNMQKEQFSMFFFYVTSLTTVNSHRTATL